MGLHDRYERGICTKEEKDVPIVKRRKRGSTRVHTGVTEEKIYLTLKVTSNGIGVLCREEEWKEKNGTRL